MWDDDMKSDLEKLVEYDMYCRGFDPSKREDIEAYWRFMLS
jgi:hypothetical protein